ncbi:MAG TPA: SprT-like domain-containing protein [Gemmatimonadales bacterium]|nr:SprT-like domain-containing protein [Gemmatimonadales bacterium]
MTRHCEPRRGEAIGSRLRDLGLHSLNRVVLHRNRVVLLTFARGVLRLHEGYASAPDDVLRAIARFLSRSTPRRDRLAARRLFLAFPVEQFASSRPTAQPSSRPAIESDRPWIQRLRAEHARLNMERFGGELGELPIRLSGRMRRRLGHVMLSRETGAAVEIAMNRRHVQRDPWPMVEDTLLHEMVHQWQAETGRRVDHGAEFRRKLAEVNGQRSTVNGRDQAITPRP